LLDWPVLKAHEKDESSQVWLFPWAMFFILIAHNHAKSQRYINIKLTIVLHTGRPLMEVWESFTP
jgi:hypothetical protein